MKIIGICGSSGAGKSTVCSYFEQFGFAILDCDAIYHELVNAPSDCLTELGKNFGEDLIEGGRLDRNKLGQIVFSDKNKLRKLNEISHRHVKLQLEKEIKRLKASDVEAAIIDAPMLFEAELDKRCDLVIAVISDEASQLSRICERDGIGREKALKRLSNQISADELIKKANIIIENKGDLSDLQNQCKEIKEIILGTEGEENE